MIPNEISQQIAELEAMKPRVQAEHERQLNYQLGMIDGRISLLQELLAALPEEPASAPAEADAAPNDDAADS
jgi:transcription elongation GreA/GreB family factor